MGTITTSDGTRLFFKDRGSGQPVVFSHGWPLSAHDRRGHGRSDQTWDGNVLDTYADLLAFVRSEAQLKEHSA